MIDDIYATDDSLDLVGKGMSALPRDEQGNVDQSELVDYVASRLEFDEQAERRRKAVRLIGLRRKPGSGTADGQLSFNGVDPYDYEPDRLVLGDEAEDGRVPIVENSRALSKVKQADARRKMKKATEAQCQAERAQHEASAHGQWTVERLMAGEDVSDLPFGRFVRESGAWQP